MQCFVGFLLGTATALTIPVTAWAQDDDVTPPVHHEHQVTERLNRAQLQYGVMPRPNPHWRWHWDAYYGRWVLRRPGYATVVYGPPPWTEGSLSERAPDGRRRAPSRSTGQADGAIRPGQLSALDKTPDANRAGGANTISPKTSASLRQNAAGSPTVSRTDRLAIKDGSNPLTPAEIRAAVPIRQVSDPKAALSKAGIRSLWGDLTGRVQNIQMDGTAVRTIEADVGSTFGEKEHIVRLDPARLKYVKSRNVLVTSMSKPDIAKLPKVNNS